MIIAVDGNEANVEKKVGVSVYTFELLHYFHNNANKDLQFRVFLREKPRSDMPVQNDYFFYQVVPGKILWSQIFLPLALFFNKKPDVFFSPAHYAPRFCPCPSVITIHDLSFYYFPQEFLQRDLHKLEHWTKYSIQNASSVIAVSENTKKDIVKFYQANEEKITVIYNGFNEKEKSRSYANFVRAKNIDEISKMNYFLYVGTIQPRKNIERLIEAYAEVEKEHNDIKLVIVGKKGWLYDDIFEKVIELNMQDKIIFTGFLLDADLAILYQHATAFVLPSLYEGFGIPVLEAMSFGCPVICSETSSLPEVGGDACLYINPSDTMDISKKMQQILSDDKLRETLAAKGKLRTKIFSWEKCGRETLGILISAANAKK